MRELTTEEFMELHDDECAEEIMYSGACRHGHAFRGGCDDPTCQFRNDE